MLYIILTSIVFTAELIILAAILICLIKFDKKILLINNTLDAIKPKIAEIMVLTNKISNQVFELVQQKIDEIREKFETDFYREISKLMLIFLVWKINRKFVMQISKSKIFKLSRNLLKLLEIVV